LKYKYTTAIDFFEWFVVEEHQLVKEMKNCNHYYNDITPNPYHLENSCWSHTLLAYMEGIKNNVSKVLQISLLLHDIGKTKARIINNEKKRINFNGHEGFSFYMAIRILDKIELTIEEKKTILSIISLHGSFYQKSKKQINYWNIKSLDLLDNVISHINYDSAGRITNQSKDNDFNEFYTKVSNKCSDDYDKNGLMITKYYTITCLIGVPNTGKSTYIKNINNNVTVISRDNVLMRVGPYIEYNKNWDWATINNKHDEITAITRQEFNNAIKFDKNIIIDMTNVSRKSRRKYLASIPKYYTKKAIVFVTPYEEIFRRNENRKGKQLNMKVMNDMFRGFIVPTYGEFDEIEWIF